MTLRPVPEARGAHGEPAGGDVAGDQGAGADDGALPDGHARQDGDARAEPDAVADGDGVAVLGAADVPVGVGQARALLEEPGVGAGDDGDAGAQLDVVAYGDGDVVEDGEVEIGEEARADAGVDAAVDVEGPAHVGVLAQGGEDLREDLAASAVELVQGVVAAAQVVGAGLHRPVAGPGGVEQEPRAGALVLVVHAPPPRALASAQPARRRPPRLIAAVRESP